MNRCSLRQAEVKQTGFSLIELMVSMIVGLLVLAAVTAIFLSMLNSNNDNLKSIRLNQDLRAAMSLMARNIRRAGSDREAAAHSIVVPAIKPFQVEGLTADQVVQVSSNEAGTANKCITFSYDEITAGTSGDRDSPGELYGYRWDETDETIQARENAATCAANSNWGDVTDNTLILIKDLNFVDTSTSTGLPGVAPVRQITVTITGELTSDATVSRTLTETINIRNN